MNCCKLCKEQIIADEPSIYNEHVCEACEGDAEQDAIDNSQLGVGA